MKYFGVVNGLNAIISDEGSIITAEQPEKAKCPATLYFLYCENIFCYNCLQIFSSNSKIEKI